MARAASGARKKSERGVSWTTSELSASTPTSGRLQPRTRGNSAGHGTGDGTFRGEIDRCRESQGWTMACSSVVCPNVTGTTKERIAQSKRACAGSLAIVD